MAGESAHGTRDQWGMKEGQYPWPIQLDPNYTPYAYIGRGTVDDPYQIADANDLGAMWQEPEACYVLTDGLDLEGIAWYGPVVDSFSGILDGQGYVLSNLTIEGVGRLGLFGSLLEGAAVENLVLEHASVFGLGDYVGTICGINNGTITQCNVDTTVIGYDYVGGLCGENAHGSGRGTVYYYVTDSHTRGSVVGHDYVGGISGGGYNSENCTSDCYVAGHHYVGKLVGD